MAKYAAIQIIDKGPRDVTYRLRAGRKGTGQVLCEVEGWRTGPSDDAAFETLWNSAKRQGYTITGQECEECE